MKIMHALLMGGLLAVVQPATGAAQPSQPRAASAASAALVGNAKPKKATAPSSPVAGRSAPAAKSTRHAPALIVGTGAGVVQTAAAQAAAVVHAAKAPAPPVSRVSAGKTKVAKP